MHTQSLVVLWATLLGCGAGSISAQEPAPRIEPGSFIQVRVAPERTLSGRYLPVGTGRIGVEARPGATDTLRLDQIRQIAVRGRHTGTGALVGAAAGAGFGTFVAIVVAASCDAADCDGARPYLISIPLFAGLGALVGAGVGAAFPSWRQVFP